VAASFRWVGDAAGLREVIAEMLETGTYGLDTEFHREKTYFAHLALLQLAWGDGEVALVDPLAVDIAPLAEVLDRDEICLMHAASQDLPILERACGVVPRRLVDTQVAAGFVGLGTPGLGALLQRRLGVSLPKADRLTDWMRRPLGDAPAGYAATDVAYLHELWESLEKELVDRGRSQWVVDECAEVVRRHTEPVDPDFAWWRIKEARRLRGTARGVAQSVAAWRELRAQDVDRPVRHVLPDLAVVAMAERPPASREALGKVRGLDGRHLKGGAATELLQAVERGRQLPDRDLRVPDREGVDSENRPAVTLASAWVGQIARDLAVDTSLLATRADIEALVRGDGTSRLLSGWRGEVAGEQVRALLSEDAALVFAGGGSLLLERRSYEAMNPHTPS
jgi:ribonuclease D